MTNCFICQRQACNDSALCEMRQARDGAAPTQARLKWLGARLERRAKDARQAADYARMMHPGGYPYAMRLAEVLAEAAAVYERELAKVISELG